MRQLVIAHAPREGPAFEIAGARKPLLNRILSK